jgi:prepilin-type N-terminal cleavage/methylation domain-containing protein
MERRVEQEIMTKQKGFSLIELLIVVAIILIIAAIAVPNLLRSRMAANEASAAGSLRTISTANVTYASTYNIGFAADITNLGPPAGGGATADSDAADLIDSVLSGGVKAGYSFTYAPGTADAAGNIPTYTTEATPVTPDSTGQSSFCVDHSAVVRKDPAGSAPGSDPDAGGCNAWAAGVPL